jgi:hypothetical protein
MSENNKTRNKWQRLLWVALKAVSSPEAARAASHLRHAELRGKLVRLPQNYRAGLWDPAWWIGISLKTGAPEHASVYEYLRRLLGATAACFSYSV